MVRLPLRGQWAILTAGLLLVVPVTLQASTAEAPPETVYAWLQREHEFLRRYLAIVRQAAHDYAYGYQTPTLLIPVTMDLFTGYVVTLHDAEEQALYPALRVHMTAEQQQGLRLVEEDQKEESGTVKQWERELQQYAEGHTSLSEVGETIDYLARMINRHLVLQEERVLPFLNALSPSEQKELLARLDTLMRRELGARGRTPYERWLAYLEGQIKAVATRVW